MYITDWITPSFLVIKTKQKKNTTKGMMAKKNNIIRQCDKICEKKVNLTLLSYTKKSKIKF